jgi:hypothetical protein
MRISARKQIVRDIVYILIGIFLAFLLSVSGLVSNLIGLFGNDHIASFVAGFFFTSAFTLAPSAVMLNSISEHSSTLSVSLWGAFGALFGDLVLFFFIRDRFADDIKNIIKPSFMRHIMSSFHFGFLKWLAPIIGALIIASPLPDEFGLTLLGMSKVRLGIIIPVAFVMNIIGIYSLIIFANTV